MYTDKAVAADAQTDFVEISREEAGLRILYSLLFVLIEVVTAVLLAMVTVFSHGYCLMTRRRPDRRVRQFADWLVDYAVQVARYLTFNREQPPFPFTDLPQR